jgi:hypothetical protein
MAARCCAVVVVTVGYGKAGRAHAAAAVTWTGTAGEKGWGRRWDSAQVNPTALLWRRTAVVRRREPGVRSAEAARCYCGVTSRLPEGAGGVVLRGVASRPAEVAGAAGFLGAVVNTLFFRDR